VWAGKQQQSKTQSVQPEQRGTEISQEWEEDEDEGEYDEADEDWEEDEFEDELEEEAEEEDEQPISRVTQIPIGATTVAFNPVSQQELDALHSVLAAVTMLVVKDADVCSYTL
jgi:hypothetical protein